MWNTFYKIWLVGCRPDTVVGRLSSLGGKIVKDEFYPAVCYICKSLFRNIEIINEKSEVNKDIIYTRVIREFLRNNHELKMYLECKEIYILKC